MFAFLRGTVAHKHADRVELDVGGVGYEVWVPARVLQRLAPDATVTLLTYCYIREDQFTIYGFLRTEERRLFRMLLTISSVGPKVALAVMGSLGVGDFGRAVAENDVKAFERVQGVGKKMAQRIVLEMKAKMGQDAELSAILGEPEAEGFDETRDDVVAALTSLGCTLGEARRAAETARKDLGADASDEDLVKAALRTLAKI